MAKIDISDYLRKHQSYFVYGTLVAVATLTVIIWLTLGPDDEVAKVSTSPVAKGSLTAIIEASGTIGSEQDSEHPDAKNEQSA